MSFFLSFELNEQRLTFALRFWNKRKRDALGNRSAEKKEMNIDIRLIILSEANNEYKVYEFFLANANLYHFTSFSLLKRDSYWIGSVPCICLWKMTIHKKV